jgi:signal transduction histidine kinase
MQQQLDTIEANYTRSNNFEKALIKQEANETEQGESNATLALRNSFNKLKSGDTSKQTIKAAERELQSILLLNMQAIQRKSKAADKTTENALATIITLGGLVFLIAFTFIVNFPSIITNPVKRLTDAIKEIGNKNYGYRIHIDNKDEFGKLADAFNEMAERLQYFENSNLNQLMFEKSRAEAVINSLKDASIGIDKNNIVLFANQQALQLLNLKSEQIIGKPVSELISRNDLFKFLIEEDNNSTPFKIVLDNYENYFTKEIIEVTQDNAKNKVIVLKNITSFKELDVAKTNFIATISHELKTPLASSDFSLKLLEDERTGTLSKEQKELVSNLKQDNQHMLKILSELLNMSQVEAGKIQLTISKVNPAEIVDNAIKSVAASAKEKKVEIKNITGINLPLIEADADKTTWILNNFLTNAIKYSFNNSVVEVFAKQQDNNIIFSVKDNGTGIAKEYLPKLFERYFQVPGSKEKGTGLGLAISKEFAEAQHGKIWAESNTGQGSQFFFMLPLQHVNV